MDGWDVLVSSYPIIVPVVRAHECRSIVVGSGRIVKALNAAQEQSTEDSETARFLGHWVVVLTLVPPLRTLVVMNSATLRAFTLERERKGCIPT